MNIRFLWNVAIPHTPFTSVRTSDLKPHTIVRPRCEIVWSMQRALFSASHIVAKRKNSKSVKGQSIHQCRATYNTLLSSMLHFSFRFFFVQCPFVPRRFPLNFFPLACCVLTVSACNVLNKRLTPFEICGEQRGTWKTIINININKF
jgi:hypothetical protein